LSSFALNPRPLTPSLSLHDALPIYYQDNPWFPQLLRRLLEGSPDVLNLLAINPFPNKPPRLVRARTYDYHFSDAPTRRRTGAIWTRRYVGEYFPVVGLKQ